MLVILRNIPSLYHVHMIPCHYGMAHSRFAYGGNGLQIWREAANILNKQSRTAYKGLLPSLVVGRGA